MSNEIGSVKSKLLFTVTLSSSPLTFLEKKVPLEVYLRAVCDGMGDDVGDRCDTLQKMAANTAVTHSSSMFLLSE